MSRPSSILRAPRTSLFLYGALRFAGDFFSASLTGRAVVNLQLMGEVLDPRSGEPIQIGGAEAVPKVITELVVMASFDSDREDMLSLDEMLFNQLRLDDSQLYESFIAPIVQPIRPIIDPISGFLDILDVVPINFVMDALTEAFPVIRLPPSIAGIVDEALDFAQALAAWSTFISAPSCRRRSIWASSRAACAAAARSCSNSGSTTRRTTVGCGFPR